jgi:2,4-dienoyl-CoA reductase-like NADH-dependent reductase (Old Yellow Enzyme family)
MNTRPAKGIPFFTPKRLHSPGTPIGPYPLDGIPTLFQPLQIRGTTLRNRIVVSPMCQYSAADSGNDIGALTPYHIMTLGNYALKGASLTFIEATGVQFNGRITPNCPGIWSDRQIEGVRNVADAIHSQGGLCGLQLAHAGRKGSTVSPLIASIYDGSNARATEETMGWPADVVGPSGGEEFTWDGIPSDDPSGGYFAPRELSLQDIQQLVKDWASAAVRSVKAGVDVLEIHAAHGVSFNCLTNSDA